MVHGLGHRHLFPGLVRSPPFRYSCGWRGRPAGPEAEGGGERLNGPESVIQAQAAAQPAAMLPPCTRTVSGAAVGLAAIFLHHELSFHSTYCCFHCLVFKRWHSFNWKEREMCCKNTYDKANLVAVGLTNLFKNFLNAEHL